MYQETGCNGSKLVNVDGKGFWTRNIGKTLKVRLGSSWHIFNCFMIHHKNLKSKALGKVAQSLPNRRKLAELPLFFVSGLDSLKCILFILSTSVGPRRMYKIVAHTLIALGSPTLNVVHSIK